MVINMYIGVSASLDRTDNLNSIFIADSWSPRILWSWVFRISKLEALIFRVRKRRLIFVSFPNINAAIRTSCWCLCFFIIQISFFSWHIQIVLYCICFILPDKCLGSRVVYVEYGRWLDFWIITSRIEKPSLMTFLRNFIFILNGIFAYLERAPTFLFFNEFMYSKKI